MESLRLTITIYPTYEDHSFYTEQGHKTAVHLKLLQLGRRFAKDGYLDNPEDIFYLNPTELRYIIIDMMDRYNYDRPYVKTDYREAIKERKKIREEQIKQAPPPTAGSFSGTLPQFPDLVWAAGITPEFIMRMMTPVPPETVEVAGHPSSRGVAEGRAVVVPSVEKIKDIKLGDILVCLATSPDWTPVFPIIKGVASDQGSPMAHHAVYAREYGIPCVTGAWGVSQLIKTGDRIRVNGDKGLVEILKK